MTTDNFCFYLQNRLIETSQTGGQWYSDTSPFSIPWSNVRIQTTLVLGWRKYKKVTALISEVLNCQVLRLPSSLSCCQIILPFWQFKNTRQKVQNVLDINRSKCKHTFQFIKLECFNFASTCSIVEQDSRLQPLLTNIRLGCKGLRTLITKQKIRLIFKCHKSFFIVKNAQDN